MNNALATLYRHAPVAIQNAMVSVYGYRLHKTRYGGCWQETLDQLEQSQWFSAEQLEELQIARLRCLLRHAHNAVPYYRRAFEQAGIRPEHIRSLEDLRRVPILSKPQMRDHAQDLLAAGTAPRHLITEHTSGTTGTALTLYNSHTVCQRVWAFVERFRRWAGIATGQKRASFGVRMVAPFEQTRPPFWRYNATERQLLFSIYHLSPANFSAYNAALRRFDPVWIDAYPSAAYALARFVLDGRHETARPKAVLTTAETLLTHQREAIQQAFGCPVYDWYGSSEYVVLACECPEGRMHINPEFGIAEILRADNTPAAPGEPGRIVVTGFVNTVQPLIRYEIGDIGVLLKETVCNCGRAFPALAELTGRVEDVVVTPDGRVIARFDPVFKDTPNIQEAQIVQQTEQDLKVKVVRAAGYSPSDTRALLRNMKERCGAQMRIKVEFVDRIARTRAGKFRAVVSRMPSPGRLRVEPQEPMIKTSTQAGARNGGPQRPTAPHSDTRA